MFMSLFSHGHAPWQRAFGAHRQCLVGLVLLIVAAAPVQAGLRLDEAVRLALDGQPQLLARQSGIEALREEAVASRQLPDPRLVFGFEGLPVDGFSFSGQDMTQTVIGVSQMIPGGDKLALSGRRLEHEAERDGVVLETERRRIERDTRLAWLDAYAAEAALALTRELEAEFSRQVEWGRVAYQSGQLAQDETLAQRAMLEAVRNRLSELAERHSRARAALVRWVGEAGRQPLASLPAPADLPPLTALLTGLEAHPELRSMQSELDAGRVDVELARQAYKPDWRVDFSYGVRGAERSDLLKLMVGVDLPLFPGKRQDRRLAARMAELRQLQARLEDRRRRLAADLAMTHAEWQGLGERLRRLERDILPLATQRVDSALTAYKTGRAGYDRVLEARRAELQARLERLNLEVDAAKAAALLGYYQ